MPPESGLPLLAVEAMKQQHYAEAIAPLEAFCETHAGSVTKDVFQAQVWLVKAYRATQQIERAIALCRHMTHSQHPKIQAWAQQTLPTLTQLQNPKGSVHSPDAQPNSSKPSLEELPVEQPSAEQPSAAQPTYPSLSAEESAELLKTGNKALKMGRFTEAIAALEAYCGGTDATAKDYEQAQTWLAKAYKGNGQLDQAIALCQTLLTSEKPFIHIWAKQYLQAIAPNIAIPTETSDSPAQAPESPEPSAATPDSKPSSPSGDSPHAKAQMPKAGRSNQRWVKLAMKQVAGNLAFASGVTLSLLSGMVLVLSLSLVFIVGSEDPLTGLIISIVVTLLFSIGSFFLSPIIMDFVQAWVYGTRWVSLSQIERYSPESARIIRTVCQQKKLQQPRLGIIDDQNPTAFTYGSFPNSARLVVSQGLFTYLDDDEAATVYAHELGHIVHWDFAVMTLASTLVQITYLIYVYTRETADKLGNSDVEKKIKNAAQTTALAAYGFYLAGEYLLLYLSRTREYYADHFAAEVTGNPNGLARALVKIAYGIVEEGQRNQQPSKVLQGTRALGISDATAATSTGTAYRVAANPYQVGRAFLWDMFNPWAWWMELTSTHPLTGKRVRALSTYAEQLGLETEFDMSRVAREGRSLNKKKLYGNFVLDLLLLRLELIGGGLGFLLGSFLLKAGMIHAIAVLSPALFGYGVGTIVKTFVMYPSFNRAPATDVLTLMSNPYASPLRGQPVKLTGEIIGRGDPGNKFGADLKLQDSTGMLFVRYESRFGALGRWLFGMTQAESFFRQPVAAVGWFRRGIMPWVDLMRLSCSTKWNVNSYHRFWLILSGLGMIVLSFVLPSL